MVPAPPRPSGVLHSDLGRTGRRWVEIFIAAILLDFVLTFAILGNHIGALDLDQFLVFHEFQYWNSKLFGGAKQWCPLMSAGLSLAAEPQVPVLSLSMLLAYVTDPLWGIRLAMLIYLGIGWAGAYLYSGQWFPRRLQRSLAASLFVGNGFFICRLAHGHVDFFPFFILPLVLYVLHRAVDWPWRRAAPAGLLIGAVISMAIDGSPVTILHVLFWIALYGVVLAWITRSAAPLILLGFMFGLAAVLDAGYLWPMVLGQSEAPRLTKDHFTHPLALSWYMLVPVWGKFFLSANGKGHELSLFIGPVLAALIWRYRRPLWTDAPAAMRVPILFVGIASLWLGMGSLRPLHVPPALSPFDLLRPLPGIRSMGVTGRYWGFLALPLSLLSAGALWHFLAARDHGPRVWICLGAALLLQIGFQSSALLSKNLTGRTYQPVAWRGEFREEETPVRFVLRADHLQGEVITPTRAVLDCYNHDDIPQAATVPGDQLVISARSTTAGPPEIHGAFVTWSRIRLHRAPSEKPVRPDAQVEVRLNQAFHRFWSSPDGAVVRGDRNNLVFRCPESRLRAGAVELSFFDPISARGMRVSRIGWSVWGVLLFCAFFAKLAEHFDVVKLLMRLRPSPTPEMGKLGKGSCP